jgi:hypothetical protein
VDWLEIVSRFVLGLAGSYLLWRLFFGWKPRRLFNVDHIIPDDMEIAEERADGLLRDILTKDEYQQFHKSNYLEVQSPSKPNRIYRVPGYKGVVKVYDKEMGKITMYLCVQSAKYLPLGDIVLMHKLHIEANEDEYLRLANYWHACPTPLLTR